MKKLVLTVLSGLLAGTGAQAQSDLLNTVQNWTGSGANEAALVIDWYNGTTSDTLMWGYRWDGSATGEQMFDAIVAADPRLFAEVSQPGEFGSFGTSVFGLGYEPGGSSNFQLSPSLAFGSDHLAVVNSSAVDDSRTAVNAGDLWLEGWNSGYWSFWTSTDSRLSVNASDWDSPNNGMTTQELGNGDVDGWSFAPGFTGPSPTDIVPASPVPEPAVLAMMALGSFGMVLWRKKS